jgi:hypothetical protein
MDLLLTDTTSELEDKLSGIYEILPKKESNLAGKINRYAASQENNNALHTLFLNIALNVCAITWLYRLFY